jgi:glyoxylase-like metal-dependent hydrolase (beta-lactamase superfamily II)
MNASAEKLLARLGIHRIETHNPLSNIDTNCYFLDGAAPTLIDTGVAANEGYDAIAFTLAQVGRSVRDIRRIILTHGHADHRALAPRIQKQSGAEVFCHKLESDKITQAPPEKSERRRNGSLDFFRSLGVPEESLPSLVDGPQSALVRPRVDCVTLLNDGDVVELGTIKLRVLHTPGHSCGSLCFHDDEHGLLFAGDTILPTAHITALIEVDMLKENPAYNPLKLHIESLNRLVELGSTTVLPGHGEPFSEYENIVKELLERHRKRQSHILRALRHGPKTLYQICRSVFLFASPDDLYLALSELHGNIKILAEEKRLSTFEQGHLTYYEK